MNHIGLDLGVIWGRLAQDPGYTDATNQAIELLRDPHHFQWYIIPIFVAVFYIYFSEIEKKNWNVVLAGLAFWGVEWFFEIINALFLTIHGTSALWTTPCVNSATGVVNSAYNILVGLNVEISLMFLFMGVVFAKVLPRDKDKKILGIGNRTFLALLFAILCVGVEVVLNFWDALIWEYPWWNWYNPVLIILLAYFPLIRSSFTVYDLKPRPKQVTVTAAIYALDVVFLVVCMGIFGWI
ncbi:MAG: hypothetical protein JW765_01310 [Deltaproteobacteria bacterium]|nr:hypothetical protein [Candidatus Zymogenaceae bacterium]